MFTQFTSLIAGVLLSITAAMAAIGPVASPVYAGNANNGVVTVTAPQSKNGIAVLVEKDGKRESYKMEAGSKNSFALLSGNGTYTVRVLEQVQGTKYRELSRQSVSATIKNQQAPYLNSVQEINFDANTKAVIKAKELTAGLKNEADKVRAIYNYVVANVEYDFEKAKKVAPPYLPNVDDTFNTGLGICYDYTSLMAAMLRSQGIATKLVKGYVEGLDTYHAWNEVWVDGQWQLIDTTLDAPVVQGGQVADMYKDAAQYSVTSAT